MRIRKRFPPSSMASSVSDPQPNNSTLVQQTSSELHPIQNNHSQPSDPPNQQPFSDQTPMMIKNSLQPHKFQINQKEEAFREQQEENGSNNNTRKEYNFLAVAPVGETGVSLTLGSHQVDGMWFDGDEKVPLKKRKGQETMLMLDEEKKMKSKSNKKCTGTSGMQQSHSEQDKAGNNYNSNSTTNNNSTVKKMNKRGGAIMEGSRCSRVNGRGWRCCQQTLVGYSLCEHHLGKGRLRSISNVKARTKAPPVVAITIAPQNDSTNSTANDSTTNDNQSSKNVLVSSSVVQPPVRDRKDSILLDGSYDDDDDDDEDENEDEDDDDYHEEETKKPLVVKKKRMKLGMVKARSLSSLLNQTN